MGKYVIVVESGSDVTPELCERYGIVRVPMHVTIGDETVEDGSIDPLEIYSRCNEFGVMPKTSGCSPADFAHVYDHFASCVFRGYDLLASVVEDCGKGPRLRLLHGYALCVGGPVACRR